MGVSQSRSVLVWMNQGELGAPMYCPRVEKKSTTMRWPTRGMEESRVKRMADRRRDLLYRVRLVSPSTSSSSL